MQKYAAFTLLFLTINAVAEGETHAIAGGDGPAGTAYISLISSTGVATPISGDTPIPTGIIDSVAINASGHAIVGGRDNGTTIPYAAVISPSGVATEISGAAIPTGNGFIRGVSINSSANGIIGGEHGGGALPYAALVDKDGVTTALSGPALFSGNGVIQSTAINDSGSGVIAGRDQGNVALYAALVSPSGVTTALSGSPPPTNNGLYFSAAINSSGNGVVGGQNEDGGSKPYAVLFDSNGVRTNLSGPSAPSGFGQISSVAINDSGNGIIGGQDNGGTTPYVALFNASGVRTALSGPAVPTGSGLILSVALNNTGNGIIGGRDNGTDGYIALVSPSGVTQALTGDLPQNPAFIGDVAIAESGVAIIGGVQDQGGGNNPYYALVSPSGIATSITGFLPGSPASEQRVAIADALIAQTTPTTVGPGFGGPAISSLLSASQTATNHAGVFQHWHGGKLKTLKRKRQREFEETDLVTASDEMTMSRILEKRERQSTYHKPRTETLAPPDLKKAFSIWFAPFYAYIDQESKDSIPASRSHIPGALAGFDYWTSESVALGGALAYAYTDIRVPSQGSAKIHQAMAVYSTTYSGDFVFVNASLWGGYYHLHTTRSTLGFISSSENTNGWLLSPHFELAASNYAKSSWFVLEPFITVDWVNNWQEGYTETGASGFNLRVGGLYNSLLRSETGLNFYQILSYGWGSLLLEERASYVNKAPFHFNPTSVSFVGSPSSFTVATGTNRVQSFAGTRFNTAFLPDNPKYPYGLIGFLGEFSPSYQSYLATFELGKDF